MVPGKSVSVIGGPGIREDPAHTGYCGSSYEVNLNFTRSRSGKNNDEAVLALQSVHQRVAVAVIHLYYADAFKVVDAACVTGDSRYIMYCGTL